MINLNEKGEKLKPFCWNQNILLTHNEMGSIFLFSASIIASACSCVPIHKEEITLRNYSCNYFQRFIKGAQMTTNCYYTKKQKDFILGIRNFSTSPSNYSNYTHMPSTKHTIYKSPYQINNLKPRYKLISFL